MCPMDKRRRSRTQGAFEGSNAANRDREKDETNRGGTSTEGGNSRHRLGTSPRSLLISPLASLAPSAKPNRMTREEPLSPLEFGIDTEDMSSYDDFSLCLLVLFIGADPPRWTDGVIAGIVVEPARIYSTDAGSGSVGHSGVVEKLGSGIATSSADTTWSQGLAVGINGPIPCDRCRPVRLSDKSFQSCA